ncbi:MAG: hypothetical protein ACREEE_18400 [Dongiaceae bacterium]
MRKELAIVGLSLVLASCSTNKPSIEQRVGQCNASMCRISLYPGETIYVEAEEKNGQLENRRVVTDNSNPDRTLVLKLEQLPAPLGMMLNVTNPFQEMLKYHVEMMIPGEDKLRQTSSCPVVPNGGQGLEMWPHPISQLVFHDFRMLEPEAEMRCEY